MLNSSIWLFHFLKIGGYCQAYYRKYAFVGKSEGSGGLAKSALGYSGLNNSQKRANLPCKRRYQMRVLVICLKKRLKNCRVLLINNRLKNRII